MDFFGIGFGEIILILVVVLIIWGPGRIVEMGLKLGRIARNLRKTTSDLTTQLTKELDIEEKESPGSNFGGQPPPGYKEEIGTNKSDS